MVEYIYPAVFHPNEDGSFTITYPDLPGCISEGKSGENALHMAQLVYNYYWQREGAH
nr:type II toxin-antitoxin system HicB family antitoxin [uncultured Acetatifactor sp.]